MRINLFVLILLLLCLISCEGYFVGTVVQPGGIVSVTSERLTHRTISLSYSNLKDYDSYCILENTQSVENCNWTRGQLPSNYYFTSNEKSIQLKVFTRKNNQIFELTEPTRLISIPYLNSMIQILKPDSSSSTTAHRQGADDQFGHDVDYDGQTFVVSSISSNLEGKVFVFEENAGVLVNTQILEASLWGDGAQSVRVDGDTIVVGNFTNHGGCSGIFPTMPSTNCDTFLSQPGDVRIFRKVAGIWLQEAYITSPNPDAADGFGFQVAIDGDLLAVGAYQEDGSGTGINPAHNNLSLDAGAVYVYKRSGNLWTLEATLKPDFISAGDKFGSSLALHGDTLVIGSPFEDSSTNIINSVPDELGTNSGAAYVFIRDIIGNWSQQAYLKPNNTGSSDRFGTSVDIDDDVIVIGADLEDSNSSGVNGANNNLASNSGAAYVFRRIGNNWTQEAYLKAHSIGTSKNTDNFGGKVKIHGDRIVVSALNEDSSSTGINSSPDESATDSGAVYVYEYLAGTWAHTHYLKASNTDAGDGFGKGLAIFNDEILVGASLEDSNSKFINGNQADNSASSKGAAYHYRFASGNWAQINYLKGSEAASAKRFSIVDAEGDYLVVGAPSEDGETGAVYVYSKSNGNWVLEARLNSNQTDIGDLFGYSVSISGTTIAVGAYAEDSNSTGINGDESNNLSLNSGAVFIFEKVAGAWVQTNYLKASNTGYSDNFGFNLDLEEDVLVVSSYYEDSNARGINGDQSNNLASNSGAFYVFRRTSGVWAQEAYIKSSNSDIGDNFGRNVSISGNTIAASSALEDSAQISDLEDNTLTDAGIIYLFSYMDHDSDGTPEWRQVQAIKPPLLEAGDGFGGSVKIHGDFLVVGANDDSAGKTEPIDLADNSVESSGVFHVFKKNQAGVYVHEQALKHIEAHHLSHLASNLYLNENYLVISQMYDRYGATGYDPQINESNLAFRSGGCSVFKRNQQTNRWEKLVYLKSPRTKPGDRFGERVAMTGTTLFIGASMDDGLTANDLISSDGAQSGAVFIYQLEDL